MTLFTRENTAGFTGCQLESLNVEWAAIVQDDGLEPETDEYYQREKQFQDEVSNRCWDASSTGYVQDGVYFLHPEGGAWRAVRYLNGHAGGRTEESLAGTHEAANDSWAGVEPAEDDLDVPDDVAESVVLAVMGEDTSSDMVVVTRRGN